MVKVAQNHKQATVFGAEHVLRGDFDVVECDEACSGSGRVGGFDGFGFDAFAARDEEDSEATLGFAADGEVARKSCY